MTGKMASTCPAIQMAEVAMLQACCRNKPVTRPSSQAGVHLQKMPTGNPPCVISISNQNWPTPEESLSMVVYLCHQPLHSDISLGLT